MGASNGGTIESYKQSGVVRGKQWLATLDNRVRESHADAHGDIVGLDEDFEVGEGSGPAPGQMGVAGEDINCRCTVMAVLGDCLRGGLTGLRSAVVLWLSRARSRTPIFARKSPHVCGDSRPSTSSESQTCGLLLAR